MATNSITINFDSAPADIQYMAQIALKVAQDKQNLINQQALAQAQSIACAPQPQQSPAGNSPPETPKTRAQRRAEKAAQRKEVKPK